MGIRSLHLGLQPPIGGPARALAAPVLNPVNVVERAAVRHREKIFTWRKGGRGAQVER
jgi:hypothetical protein